MEPFGISGNVDVLYNMPPKKRKLAESNDDELTNEEGSECELMQDGYRVADNTLTHVADVPNPVSIAPVKLTSVILCLGRCIG